MPSTSDSAVRSPAFTSRPAVRSGGRVLAVLGRGAGMPGWVGRPPSREIRARGVPAIEVVTACQAASASARERPLPPPTARSAAERRAARVRGISWRRARGRTRGYHDRPDLQRVASARSPGLTETARSPAAQEPRAVDQGRCCRSRGLRKSGTGSSAEHRAAGCPLGDSPPDTPGTALWVT